MAADEEETLLAPAPTVVVVLPQQQLHQQHRSAEIATSASAKLCDDADANMSKATFVQVGNSFPFQLVKCIVRF
jgi:hypothetical protein